MNEQQVNQQATGQGTAANRCLCREIADRFQDLLGVSPEVRKHLVNSRIEILKAFREMLDARIERLSESGQHGTKISVE